MKISPYILPGLKFHADITRPHEESLDKVLDFYKVTMADLHGRSRKRNLVEARQICMCVLHNLHKWTLKSTADLFNRDHTTTIHSIQAVKNLSQTDIDFHKRLNNMFPTLIPLLTSKKDYAQ